jgi:hypothetical membrane protein
MNAEQRGLPSRFVKIYPFLGMAGTVLICVVMLVAALAYAGRQGQPYSPLNHFVSELGEVGVSRAAWLFNAGLVAAGVLFATFCAGLGLHLATAWSYVAMAAGICSGIFAAGVGLFPMNNLVPHIFVATWFFRAGLGAVMLFAVAIALQKRGQVRVHRAAVAVSAAAAAAYASFLATANLPASGRASSLDTSGMSARPAFWPVALLEWVVILATFLWFLGVSLTVRRTVPTRPKGGPKARGA